MDSREIKVNINNTNMALRYVNNAISDLGEGRGNLQGSNSALQGALGGSAANRLHESVQRCTSDIDNEISELKSIIREMNNAVEELEQKDRELAKNQ